MTRRLRNPLVAAAATLLLACTATTATQLPTGDGNVAGGPSTGSSPPPGDTSDAGTPPPPQPPTGSVDSGSPPPASSSDSGNPGVVDSGHGYFIDTGVGGHDAGVPTAQGPLGSCGNPACGTDLNECGCTATDSAGNTVQLGCQAGGQCECFVNQQLQDNPFDENGACSDAPSTQQQFLQFCTCN